MHIIFSSLEPLTNEHFLNNHLLYIWTEIFKVQFDWGACGFGPPATAAELISALMALTQKAFTAPSAVAAYRWPPTAHPGSHPILPFGAASCSCCSGMIYIQSEHVVRVFFFLLPISAGGQSCRIRAMAEIKVVTPLTKTVQNVKMCEIPYGLAKNSRWVGLFFFNLFHIFWYAKKFSFGNCNHHCCCRSFAATFWHKGCVAGARPRPHSILMLILFLFLLLLLPSSCVREFGFPFFFGCPFQLRNHLRPSVAGVGCGGWSRGQRDYTACLLLGQRQKISARVCIEFKRRFIIIFCAPSYSPFSLLRFLPSLFISAYIFFLSVMNLI